MERHRALPGPKAGSVGERAAHSPFELLLPYSAAVLVPVFVPGRVGQRRQIKGRALGIGVCRRERPRLDLLTAAAAEEQSRGAAKPIHLSVDKIDIASSTT